MSSPYNDPAFSALHSQPTQPLRAYLVPKAYLPGYLWSDQEDWEEEQDHKARLREALKTLERQEQSIFAWQPVVVFLVVFVAYGLLGCFLASIMGQALVVPWGH